MRSERFAHISPGASSGWLIKAETVQFPIKRRAADPQLAGDFRHLSTIVGDSEANDLCFDVFERPHLPAGIE